MAKYIYLFAAFLMVSLNVAAQEQFPKLVDKDIDGLIITQEKYFDGNSLWGFMDGGADVYLEYGFQKLLDQETSKNNIKYKVDIYKMMDAESAFGIYSIFSFKCASQNISNMYCCISKYQVQSAVGYYYISVINDKGYDEAKTSSLDIIRILSGKITAKTAELPALFDVDELKNYKNGVKFIKGKLGIQNGFAEWEDMFTDITSYSFYVMPVDAPKGEIKVAVINFTNLHEVKNFYERMKLEVPVKDSFCEKLADGKHIYLWKAKEDKIVLVESFESGNETERIKEAINKYLGS